MEQFKVDNSSYSMSIGFSYYGERKETCIDEAIVESYVQLHEIGFAHSVECWDADGLQGGLYGVSLGQAFFGESMFSRKTDASKVALVHLVEWLREEQYLILDTQWMTDHLRQFGGEEVLEAYIYICYRKNQKTRCDSNHGGLSDHKSEIIPDSNHSRN